MRKYVLEWSIIGKVKELYPLLRGKTVRDSDHIFPQLMKPGIYMFLNDQGHVVDIGEANAYKRGLRKRIRNEIYENSQFSKKLKNMKMERSEQLELALKVGIVKEGIDFSRAPEDVDKHLRFIERALICHTDPSAHSHGGVENWACREEIEITNYGDCSPLKSIVKICPRELCFRRQA